MSIMYYPDNQRQELQIFYIDSSLYLKLSFAKIVALGFPKPLE